MRTMRARGSMWDVSDEPGREQVFVAPPGPSAALRDRQRPDSGTAVNRLGDTHFSGSASGTAQVFARPLSSRRNARINGVLSSHSLAGRSAMSGAPISRAKDSLEVPKRKMSVTSWNSHRRTEHRWKRSAWMRRNPMTFERYSVLISLSRCG